MKNKYLCGISAVLVWTIASGAAQAATLTLQSSARAQTTFGTDTTGCEGTGPADGTCAYQFQDSAGTGAGIPTDATSVQVNGSVAPTDIPETASAFSSVNSVTGELKVSTSFSHLVSPLPSPSSPFTIAQSQALIIEDFVLNGTGTLEAFMAVDAVFDLAGANGGANAQLSVEQRDGFIEVDGELVPNIDSDVVEFSPIAGDTDFGPTGSVDDYLLSSSINFTDAVNSSGRITWGIGSLLLSSTFTPGLEVDFDATSTATIFFRTTGSLVATPSSSTFLSNEVFTTDTGTQPLTPVPLPAGLPLMLSGLLGIGLLARRKKAA